MLEVNKTKICNVSMHYFPINGGQEVYIDNLNKILEKIGFEVSVLQRNAKTAIPEGKKIYFVPRIIKSISFLKIISNIGWFAFNIGLLLSKKILKKQDIILCHYPFHYPVIRHNKIIIISHGVLWSKNPKTLFDKYHKKISLKLKNSKDIFIVSNDTHFLREIGYDAPPNKNHFKEIFKNVWFIPNCIDTTFFSRKENIKKEKIILVPRNIRPDRGIHLAIESFNIFKKQHNEYKMFIVGSGSGKYYNFCRNLVKKYGLENEIIFKGHAEKDEMLIYYNRAAVTLIPTIEKEGTSLSALESMSCGTATITTSVAGLLDLPAIQTKLDVVDIANNISYVIKNIDSISKHQQDITINNYNMVLWEKAWTNVINTVAKK